MICSVVMYKDEIRKRKISPEYPDSIILLAIGLELYNIWNSGENVWHNAERWEDRFAAAKSLVKDKGIMLKGWKLSIREEEDRFAVIIETEGSGEVYAEADVEEVYRRLFTGICIERKDGYSLLPAHQAEKREKANSTAAFIKAKCLHESLFKADPDRDGRTALIWYEGDIRQKMDYKALRNQVLRVVHMLKQHGVKMEDKVAVMLPKGRDQILAVLGILSAGAVYVPISFDQPADRVRDILEIGEIPYLLAQEKSCQLEEKTEVILFKEHEEYSPDTEPRLLSPDNAAYVIFTSGSTGKPKGVVVSHESAFNTIEDINRRFSVTGEDCVLAVSELSFDLSVYDLFGMLNCGGCIVIPDEKDKKEPHMWFRYITENAVSVWNSVPTLYEMLLTVIEQQKKEVSLKKVFLSGDWVMPDAYSRTLSFTSACRVIAMGGATEAAIWSNYFDMEAMGEGCEAVPYGKPLANQKLRVVDYKGRDCPDYVPGELWIGGKGVALGYLNQPELTKERFLRLEGEKWYRTGDKARYNGDGTVEFLGRMDHQVKISGFRIELGEIENVLKRLEYIRDAVVSVDKEAKKSLTASIVPRFGGENQKTELLNEGLYESCDKDREERNRAVEKCILMLLLSEGVPQNMQEHMQRYELKAAVECIFDWLEKRRVISRHGDGFSEGARWREVSEGSQDKTALAGEILRERDTVIAVLTGKQPINDLLGISAFNPEKLLASSEIIHRYMDYMERYFSDEGKGIGIALRKRIGFLNIRSGYLLKGLIEKLREKYDIVLFDQSLGMLELAKEALGVGKGLQFRQLAGNYIDGGLAEAFDYIVAVNSLHQYQDCHAGLQTADMLLKKDGIFLGMEYTDMEAMALISSAILENGFEKYWSKRSKKYSPFLKAEEWKKAFERTNFERSLIRNYAAGAFIIFEAYKGGCGAGLAEADIRQYMKAKLPEYMQPGAYYYFREFPLNSNGKTDRKKVNPGRRKALHNAEGKRTLTATEKKVSDLWSRVMGIEGAGREGDFFEMGGDSLIATRFIHSVMNEFNIELKLGEIFDKPKLHEMSKLIEEKTEELKELVEGEI
ncbi:yersiniabactin nonribosomal peptide synthetase/dihydroaeruginoic acid synthetase [Ruminiclostridium sufflavum DSM 19573]|uniref:Yersiniabactin nonribosomal peptide synthetase/dihydroaeruginoic acid synthetase n=2 Tax=Ruminiclostridium TaxID=1508657 RepID=A0A318Y3U6_9FIRM|nr:yersiniabactin nonribosomal peptide synthetase/dihydroaeruginoic acid synthetase [Ruminiclostridium sufflavum DSM 19573]